MFRLALSRCQDCGAQLGDFPYILNELLKTFLAPIYIYLYLAYSNDSTIVKSKGTLLTEGFIHPPAGAMQSPQVGQGLILILLSLHFGDVPGEYLEPKS